MNTRLNFGASWIQTIDQKTLQLCSDTFRAFWSTTESLYLKLGRDWDNISGLPTITICSPVLAISCWFWLNKFRIGEMGAELLAMTSSRRHVCNPHRECAKRNLRGKNFDLLLLSVTAVCDSVPSLDRYVAKACFLSDYRECVYLHDRPRALLLLT